MINLRFNKMLKEQGWHYNVFSMRGGSTLKVLYDSDSNPVNQQQLLERYECFKQAHGCIANPEKFSLVVPLKTYYVRLDV